jgi:Flp pilus assembly protein TadD
MGWGLKIRGVRALAALATVAAALAPGFAHAAWNKAESDRFIVYGDGDPRTVRDFATRLTIYDQVLHVLSPTASNRLDPQKVEVYLVHNHADLRRVLPTARQNMVGFYSASPLAIYAVAQTNGDALGISAEATLFHEYAHHFMKENFPAAYPTWFVEGWAEYFMTTEIKPSSITVGGYNANRVAWLKGGRWLPLSDLLTKRPTEVTSVNAPLFYPEAWALVHYMQDDPARAAQLDKAIRAIADGADPVKAIETATGQSLDDLTHKLQNYDRIHELRIATTTFNMNPKVTVSALPASAEDLLLDSLRLEHSGPAKEDAAFVEQVRKEAARHPGDRFAEMVLARLEFTYGDVAAGEAIVKRLLDANPDDVGVLRLAGEGQILAGRRDPAHRVDRFRAARPMLIKAYGLNSEDFRVLYQYVVSRTVEPNYPDDNDLKALFAARSLAPAVPEISLMTGEALIRQGRRDDAAKVLAMVANDPHGGSEGVQARALIAGKSLAEAAKEAREAAAEPAS